MSTNEPPNVEGPGRRHAARSKPPRRRTRQNLGLIAILVGLALVIVGLVAIPQILAANNAANSNTNIVQITPFARPQASGLAAGNPNAKIKIDVYEDFQCPYCRLYSEQVEAQLMKNEVAAGTAYYVYHHFLIIDGNVTWDSPQKESHQAANASMCAADQNRFWDYHDMLFSNQIGENAGSFTDSRLATFAQDLGLDMIKFNECFKSNAHKAQIDADVALGTSLGVGGTPTVFVNGKDVAPNKVPTYAEVQAAIAAVK
jgi:protein-disulfide isomerase